MRKLPDREELEEAKWVGDEPAHDMAFTEFWRRFWRRQIECLLVAVIVLLLLIGLRSLNGIAGWITSHIGIAAKTRMSEKFSHALGLSGMENRLASFRNWLKKEWQVNGDNLNLDKPTTTISLSLPVKAGSIMVNGPGSLGLDLKVPAGTLVLAGADGKVNLSRMEDNGEFTLVLAHNGGWRTVYGLCRTVLVTTGEHVVTGQTIALVGSAKPPAPSHLHFELWGPQGQVNPLGYLRQSVGEHGPI